MWGGGCSVGGCALLCRVRLSVMRVVCTRADAAAVRTRLFGSNFRYRRGMAPTLNCELQALWMDPLWPSTSTAASYDCLSMHTSLCAIVCLVYTALEYTFINTSLFSLPLPPTLCVRIAGYPSPIAFSTSTPAAMGKTTSWSAANPLRLIRDTGLAPTAVAPALLRQPQGTALLPPAGRARRLPPG